MILPVKYPIITSFPPYANNLSILAAKSESLEWIYNNFIGLEAFEFNDGILIRFTDSLIDCPFLSLSMIERKIVKDDILDYFKKLIDNQFYISVHIDQYYLSNSDKYRSKTYVHPVFIYGYKDNMFNVGDFFINDKYSFDLASFEEIREAYNNFIRNDNMTQLNSYPDHIKLSKYINNSKVKLDSGLIKNNLINYMLSKGVKKKTDRIIPALVCQFMIC